MRKRKAILIENNSQTTLVFESISALKRWAKKHGWKVKKSWASDLSDVAVYYTESYVVLPTGFKD